MLIKPDFILFFLTVKQKKLNVKQNPLKPEIALTSIDNLKTTCFSICYFVDSICMFCYIFLKPLELYKLLKLYMLMCLTG